MFYKVLLLVFLLVALMVPASGYAQESDEGVVLFIGTVTDTPDEFVGLAIDGDKVTVYICDGNAELDMVTVAQWFIGESVGYAVDLTAPNGSRVEAVVEGERASGKIRLADGSERDFTVGLAEGKAALFRAEFEIGEDRLVGGWLILADGSIRGAIFAAGTGELFPASFSGGNQVFQIDPIDLPAR